jgi:hypothetical protein
MDGEELAARMPRPRLHIVWAVDQPCDLACAVGVSSGWASTTRGHAVPSQMRQLAAVLKDHFGVQLQWKGEGEAYAMWWDQAGAPDVSKVAEFAEMLGMVVSMEGYSA